MEIKITSGLPLKEAHDIEMAQLQRARAASSFYLRLNAEGKLDKHAFSQLLTAARASNAYQANQRHYQFKLKSDGTLSHPQTSGPLEPFQGCIRLGS